MPYPLVVRKYLQNPLCNRSKIFSSKLFIYLGQKDTKCEILAFTKTTSPCPCLMRVLMKVLLFYFYTVFFKKIN